MEPQFKFRSVDLNHSGLEIALVLVTEHNGIQRCVGSAFAVAPGLAITASHVIDECISYQERLDGYKRGNVNIPLTAVQSYDEKVFVWLVDYIYGSVSSDTAFLRFVRPNWWGDGPGQIKPKFARLNFNPPEVGDTVRVFGFPNSEFVDGILNIYPSECECRVQKVDVRTDQPKWYKPLAYLEIEGEIRPGMSGGPCFDKDWNVVGVNSLGWDGLPLAKVALLWPAMRIEIDLFKTGLFPAMDLFKSGETKALGYRRVYVTSTKATLFAHVDPDELKPLGWFGMTEGLSGAIDFAAAGAQQALAELRDSFSRAQDGTADLDSNKIIRLSRYYFWELESALRLSLLLAARQVSLTVAEPPSWEQLVLAWRAKSPNGEVLDEIAGLEIDWNSVDLFEIRTYAELCRAGIVGLESMVSVVDGKPTGPVKIASIAPICRKGGQQIFLPDGLDHFMESARRFVQRLLRLSKSAA